MRAASDGAPVRQGARVVCVGDVMVDVVARLFGPLQIGSDSPGQVDLRGGGSAANTAAWLIAAGASASLVGRVGDDLFGRWACAELQAGGVDLAVSVDANLPTGTCVVLVGTDGERTMVPAAGANVGLDAGALRADLLRTGDYLHLSAYTVLKNETRPAALAWLRAARERGALVSVDAASSAPLGTVEAGRFFGWIGEALLIANRDEAQVLCAESDPRHAALLLARRCGEAIVKCGRDGAVWSDGRQAISCPTTALDAVDSTGAGDAFAAGMLAERLSGADAPDSVRAGNLLAARAVTRVGARPTRP